MILENRELKKKNEELENQIKQINEQLEYLFKVIKEKPETVKTETVKKVIDKLD